MEGRTDCGRLDLKILHRRTRGFLSGFLIPMPIYIENYGLKVLRLRSWIEVFGVAGFE